MAAFVAHAEVADSGAIVGNNVVGAAFWYPPIGLIVSNGPSQKRYIYRPLSVYHIKDEHNIF